jgi:hypothetical protein
MKNNIWSTHFVSGITYEETMKSCIQIVDDIKTDTSENIIWHEVTKDAISDFVEIDRWISSLEGNIRDDLEIIRNYQILNIWIFFEDIEMNLKRKFTNMNKGIVDNVELDNIN